MDKGNAQQSTWSVNHHANSNRRDFYLTRTPEFWEQRHAVICGCSQQAECIAEMKRDFGI